MKEKVTKKETIVNLNEDLSSKKQHDSNSFEQALKQQEAVKKQMKESK